MLGAASGVLVAVSGGPDSVALLDMLLRLSSESSSDPRATPSPAGANSQPLSALAHLHVAHLDHRLRGRDSAEDAEFVRALAKRIGVECTIDSIDIRAAAHAAGRGVEETAREIRYDFLRNVAEATGCNRLAVGHTMTDQAETFIMRLIRGAGTRGLAAMRPVRMFEGTTGEAETERGGDWERGRALESKNSPRLPVAPSPGRSVAPSPLLIRPLLCITREEVEAYCRERGLEFRTDVTNRDSRYTRNRIRSEIMPTLTEMNPRIVESIARAADNLASDQEALDSISSTLMNEARIQCSNNRSNNGEMSVAWSATTLLNQPLGIRRRMIIEALHLVSASRGEISSTHVDDVAALLQPESSGKRISVPGRLEVWREFDALVVTRSCAEPGNYLVALSSTDPVAQAGEFKFTLQRGLPGATHKSAIETTQREKERTGFDWMSVALLDDFLPDCLLIRPRRSGERAHVFGQRKTKKLKNLMIDHRIPSSRRANWPVVTTPDGRYVWSPGLPPALEFTARDDSQCVAVLRASVI